MMCTCNNWGFYVDIEKSNDSICNECKQFIYTVCQNNNNNTESVKKKKEIKKNKENRNYLFNLFFNKCTFFLLIHLDNLLTRLNIELNE